MFISEIGSAMAEAKDLLRGLSGDFCKAIPASEEIAGEIELSLGLSLGGNREHDAKRSRSSLLRSSSFSYLPSLQHREEDDCRSGTALARTSSLPVETEEEQRKRKELQFLRRLEAKRKRSEKRNGCSGSRSSVRNRTADGEEETTSKGQGTIHGDFGKDFSLRSVGSEVKGMMEEMPCVFTVGGGGKRVEGFLYRYAKGEEVRIVCVCHGSFFSPAEFVEHAGGGSVAHPLKHIVVNSGF